MNKPLYLFVGPSGSGKTTIVDELECRYQYKSLQSYTTRPPRCEDEYGHIFVSDNEFDNLQNIIAYTEYNGFRYCATEELINNADLYVIDCDGVDTLLSKYNSDRTICIFYFDTTVSVRINRMIERGDSDMEIVSRLHNDEQFDWYDKLEKIVWNYSKLQDKQNVELYRVNANSSKANVLGLVLYYINKVEE